MKTDIQCADAAELLCDFVDGTLPPDDQTALEDHLRGCPACRKAAERDRAVRGLLKGSFAGAGVSENFAQTTGQRLHAITTGAREPLEVGVGDYAEAPSESSIELLQSRFGAAPWWVISLCFHGLAILLLGLLTMALKTNQHDELILVTNLTKDIEQVAEKPPEPPTVRDILESDVQVDATAQDSVEQSNIVVPLDMLAKAEIGDHFETINPDRPDTQSAFGNPDARMFHSVSGNDEPEGGGGNGGLAALEDVIGMGGGASAGSGGGWGGGKGTGIGIGTGSGKGSFGQRSGGGRRLMVMRHGGSAKTESAVDAALAWLARHQEKDGSWNAEKYRDNKVTRWGYQPDLSTKYDSGITGFALLAFLGAGHSSRTGKYKGNVKAGVAWLLSQQGADGDFTSKVKPCHDSVTYYCHCIATLALAEALAMEGGVKGRQDTYQASQGKLEGLAGAVAKGVELILAWQNKNPSGGWTYYPPYTVTDVTVSGWAVMALKSAKISGIEIPMESFRKASDAVKKCTYIDKTQGAYGKADIGYLRQRSHEFNSKGYAITAAGTMIQVFVGGDREEAGIDAGLETITQEDALPVWNFNPADAHTDHQNLYYWYYGTMACFQGGGDAWKKWNDKLKAALVPNQRKGGPLDGTPQDVDGSWDPNDVWGAWSGRVYSTCLAALSLEVYYRYLPIYR